MIIITDKSGNQKRLFLNENVILLNREDNISFIIKDDTVKMDITLNFIFSDEGKEMSTTGHISDDQKIFTITLHQWNDAVATEITEPVKLTSDSGKIFWMKFKTSADKKNSFRSFHLTLWIEE